MTSVQGLRAGFIFPLFALCILSASCQVKHTPIDLGKESIIPIPVSVSATNSSFILYASTDISIASGNAELTGIGNYLGGVLRPATGFALPVKAVSSAPSRGIYLALAPDKTSLGEEGYELTITENLVSLIALQPAGLFRGIQTLRQLFPAKIELKVKQAGPWEIGTGTITDNPVYAYRGVMLDVSRHFFGVADVKRYIDQIAYYKYNVLHLGLSNDQGWRIEIKSWPKLATYGGSTQVGGGKGGYYTQEQFKDIVKYAQARYITIVPEIDMPGHTNAALASYPELNCNGKTPKLYSGMEVGFSSFCMNSELVYKFIDDVMRELSAISPGPYIHIGGDESHSTKKEDYIPFVNRVQEIVAKHGKKVIGWDEISLGALKPTTVAQVWASVKNATSTVQQGSKVLMSPAARAYIDMKYDSTTKLGLKWAGYIEVDKAYTWDPATYTPGVTRDNIIGVETTLWTETLSKKEELDFMSFPRLPGYAEIGWSAAGARNWDTYKLRLAKHGARFKAMGINYYPSKLVPWSQQ